MILVSTHVKNMFDLLLKRSQSNSRPLPLNVIYIQMNKLQKKMISKDLRNIYKS